MADCTYGIFVWRGDGRYLKSDAVKMYFREADAQKYADAHREKNYVVRILALIAR